MKRDRNHQIDELAKQIFYAAIPVTWHYNEHRADYGKDFEVEIGEANGDQTGITFYVQLKGQEHAQITSDGRWVRFSKLEWKHATYYLDQVQDLPVFLVVVDVKARKGWYVFLQQQLRFDQSWRTQKSVTVLLPIGNDLADSAKLRQAIEEARREMRRMNPPALQDAIEGQRERIREADPRLEAELIVRNGQPGFTLHPKEKVNLGFHFQGKREEVGPKVTDLLERGLLVQFGPGEMSIQGSKLFQEFEKVGGALQIAIRQAGTFTFLCKGVDGQELDRLSEVPGQYTGGMKELCFEGGFEASPLSIKVGPITPGAGGSIILNMRLGAWDGQRLRLLAFFDRLHRFFNALALSSEVAVECCYHGNLWFSMRAPWQDKGITGPLTEYLGVTDKARKLAERFRIDPTWTIVSFDNETRQAVEEMYGVFFENGWRRKVSGMGITATLDRRPKENSPVPIKTTSNIVFNLLGENIEVGRIVHEFTNMVIQPARRKPVVDRRPYARFFGPRDIRKKIKKWVKVLLTATENTVLTIRMAEPADG